MQSRGKVAVYVAALEEPAIESVEEIENAVENQSVDSLYKRFDDLLEKTMQDYAVGDRVVGTVSLVDEKGAFVDVGGKSPAWVPLQEMSSFKVEDATQVLATGQEREFQVVYRNKNPRKGRHDIVVSLKEIERELCWKRIQQLAEEKVSISAKVNGGNGGGVFAEIEGIRGFCPGSHIPQAEKDDGQNLDGKVMSFSILEADPSNDRLVISARTKFVPSPDAATSYKVGDVVLGTVKSVQLYGAFLDVGNEMSGLLHISQISQDRVHSVGDVLSVGDQIKVMVLTYDTERARLSLSTRKLEPSPGDMLKNPQLVFEKADEMAARFRKLLAEAELEFGDGSSAEAAEA